MTTQATPATAPMPRRPDETHRVAPWWMGTLFLLPVRRFIEPPGRLLDRWIRPGDRVREAGCEEVARPRAPRQQIAVFRRPGDASGGPLPAPAGPATLPANPSPPDPTQETPSC